MAEVYLTDDCLDIYLLAPIPRQRHYVSVHRHSIDGQRHAVSRPCSLDFHVISDTAKLARRFESTPTLRHHGRNLQAVVRSTNAENPLRDCEIVPGGGPGQPGVLRFAVRGSVATSNHLRIDIGFAAVKVTDLLARRRIDSRIVIESRVAVAYARFANHHPGIVVAENSSVLLISRWIRGDLAQVQVVLRKSGLLQNDAVLGCEVLASRFERLRRHTIVQPDTGKRAEALRLDEYLPFLALLRADLVSEVVVGAEKPFAIPAMLANRVFHLRNFVEIFLPQLLRIGALPGSAVRGARTLDCDLGQFPPRQAKQSGDENRLRHLAFFVGCGLKRLPGRIREAIQVQAIIPVGAADER